MSSALQVLNGNNKVSEWAARITECRNSGLSVKEWCSKNNVCTQTYYRWQKRLFEMAKARQEVRFTEVTSAQPVRSDNVAVTVRIAGAEVDICNGADAGTVETVDTETPRPAIEKQGGAISCCLFFANLLSLGAGLL